MAINYDGLHELRFQYTTVIAARPIIHKFTIDFAPAGFLPPPGTPFSGIEVALHGGGTSTLDVEVDELMTYILPTYTVGTEWNYVEYWRYPPEPSADAVYHGVYGLADPGTGPGAADTPASQGTFTFRTLNGGIMRVQLMEWRHNLFNRETLPYALAEFNNLANFMTGTSHPWVGRDNSRPLASIALGHGQNEKLGRKRHRAI